MHKPSLYLALACGFAALSAFASTANLQVTGQLQPQSCDISLAENGALDFGTFSHSDLQAGQETQLGAARRIQLDLRCSAVTRVGFEAVDNHPLPATAEPSRFTLASQGDTVVAWFNLSGAPTWDNGRPGSLVSDRARDGQWQRGSGVGNGWLHSVGRNGGREPTDLQNASIGLNVRAYAAPREVVDPAQPLTFAGNVAFSLFYL